MIKIIEKNPNYYLIDYESGTFIKDNYTLTRKEYESLISDIWEVDVNSSKEDEIDEFTGLPYKDIPTMFSNYKTSIITETGSEIQIIIFNKEFLRIFQEKKSGDTFLFVPYTAKYTKNTCTKGQFLENRIVRVFKTKQELNYELILKTLHRIKERVIERKATVYLSKPCSVEGYETYIEKTDIIKDMKIKEEYGAIGVYLYFEDNNIIDTWIGNDVIFQEKNNSFIMSWAGATATDELEIELLD